MAVGRKAQDLRAKEARQKKLAVAGLLVLVVLLAIQAPKLLHRGGGSAAPAPASTVPGTTTPVAPAAASLADTDVPPTPAEGQLVRFDRFETKDPFVQQVTDAAAGDATAAAPTDSASAGPTAAPAPATSAPSSGGFGAAPVAPAVPTTAVAALTVNGVAETAQADHDFPAAAPAFRLASFTADAAEIAVADGSFASGAPTITLAKGVPLTLQNTADGTKYVLVYRGRKRVPTTTTTG